MRAARFAALVLALGACLLACERAEQSRGAAREAPPPVADSGGAGPSAATPAGEGAVTRDAPSAAPIPLPDDVRTASEYATDPAFANADLERGELLSLACAACHTFGAGQNTIIGPNLHGVFGRRAAVLPDFDYSPGLRDSGLVWTPRTLEAWLADPATFVPGTKMTFTGYRSAEDRRDLIAYLLRVTG